MTSVADRVTMATVVPYFQAQMTMLDSEAKIYCSTVASFGKVANPFAADAAIHTLHRAMHELMSYARTLLEDAGREIAGLPGFFGAWRSQRDHPFEVFKGTEQIIYGSYSGMTHTDRAPYIPVAVLRTAIELRLRHAFGIYSLVDPAKPQDTSPIDMGRLFEAMQKKQSEIEFAVDMHDVGESTDGATFIFTEGSGTSHGSQVFCFDISVPSSSARPIA